MEIKKYVFMHLLKIFIFISIFTSLLKAQTNQLPEVVSGKIDRIEHFKSEYITDRQARSEAPMLAVQCMIVSIGNLPPYLELQCTNGQSVKMALTNELVHALTSMMQLATREAGWDLLIAADSTQVNIHASTQTLH